MRLFTTSLMLVCLAPFAASQQEFNITIARHVTANASNVPAMLAAGSGFLQDSSGGCGDVSICLELNQASQIAFGSSGDGLGVVTTQAEASAVFAVPAQGKVVVALSNCSGSINSSILGCAQSIPSTPPSSPGLTRNMICEESSSVNGFGAVWVHEVGHTQGLIHDDSCNSRMMNSTASFFNVDRSVTAEQGFIWSFSPEVVDLANCGDPLPSNDICSGATAVNVGDTVLGDTTDATWDNAPFCVTNDLLSSGISGGLWYSVMGTGTTLSASTCNQAGFDTKIRVYSGSCGAFTCETGSNDAVGCGATSRADWCSALGTQYWILVHGNLADAGPFSLSVEEVDPQLCSTGVSNYCDNGGNGATMASFGQLSLAANDFQLQCTGAPVTPGLFFFGLNPTSQLFGEGFLCVGQPLFRLQPATVPATPGLAVRMLDFAGNGNESNITPGAVWHFQYWFRAPGGGGLFDLSDGLAVVFAP